MPKKIAGVLPIIHTAFDEQENIDFDSLARQADWAFQVGASGYCTGMASEILKLTAAERMELPARLVEMNGQRGVVVMSVSAESTRQALEYAAAAEAAGCDGVMAVPPISSALGSDEIVAYYSNIARHISLPVIVQDASAYVGKAIDMSVNSRLIDAFGPEKILFKPEGEPIGPNLSALREATNGQARIFEGSGGILLLDSYRRGIAGTMPGMEILDAIVKLWHALGSGDEETAYRIHFPIASLVSIQMQAGLDGFLAVEKYLLKKRGMITTTTRRQPYYWEMDEETTAEVDRLFDRLQAAL